MTTEVGVCNGLTHSAHDRQHRKDQHVQSTAGDARDGSADDAHDDQGKESVADSGSSTQYEAFPLRRLTRNSANASESQSETKNNLTTGGDNRPLI